MVPRQKKSDTLTNLLKIAGISLHPATINLALLKTGNAEMAEYLSTTGSGEVKTFLRLTEAGMQFGENGWSSHPIKTSVRIYTSSFPELIRITMNELNDEVATFLSGTSSNS